MHFQSSLIVAALASLAATSPIESRQLLGGIGGTGSTSKEFSTGGCKDVLFAWARGSTEIGNMVSHPSASLPLPHHDCLNTH
jgi:cutinase